MKYMYWAQEPEQWSKDLVFIIQGFLIKSVACGVSMMSEDFIDSMGISHSVMAEVLTEKIEATGITLVFKDSAHEVEDSVSNKTSPWEDLVEGSYTCTRSEARKLNEKVKKLKEYNAVEGGGLGEGAQLTIKRRFQEVDAVFRHLRNALAHGCFRIIDESKIFFFNINTSNNLSAYGLLSFDHFKSLYELMCSLAKRRM